MSEAKTCPCCGRHCDLSAPSCSRGEEYARTGKIPEGHHHGEGHRGEGHHRHVPYRELDVNDKLIDGLRSLSRLMRTQYEGKASQQRILMILNSAGPLTQRDLTEQLDIQPGSASEILSKLESAGLILRTQNETDRRTTDIALTGEGKALALEAADQRHKRHEEMFSCLSEEEKETLLALLEKVREDWRSRYRGDKGACEHGGHHGHHGPHGPHGEDHGEGHDHHQDGPRH